MDGKEDILMTQPTVPNKYCDLAALERAMDAEAQFYRLFPEVWSPQNNESLRFFLCQAFEDDEMDGEEVLNYNPLPFWPSSVMTLSFSVLVDPLSDPLMIFLTFCYHRNHLYPCLCLCSLKILGRCFRNNWVEPLVVTFFVDKGSPPANQNQVCSDSCFFLRLPLSGSGWCTAKQKCRPPLAPDLSKFPNFEMHKGHTHDQWKKRKPWLIR